ncbi:MAG: hypothetical protein H7A35_08180 [Planctomycetales bacterium]|nr:hypothetical protein [bacterium]UNM06862.1 MAG: hypothetical protein H7A35_08180 [Planctomycetales bacterium]
MSILRIRYCSSQSRRAAALALGLLISVLISACGGGGSGSGQPDPTPNYPDPVEEMSTADIAGAGLPDPASLASISSKSSSMLDFPEDKQLVLNLSLGWESVIASRNLDELSGGKGWEVNAETSETGRVLAWAVYRIAPGTDPGNGGGLHLWKLEYEMQKSRPGMRLFYAVANQTRGGWELGGQFNSSQGGGGIFNNGGTLNFSQSEDYVFPSGSYLAILVGHPGNGNFSNMSCQFGKCFCYPGLDSASENYPDEEYSMQWGEDSFSLIKDGTSNTLGFNIGMPPTFSARLALGTNTENQLAMASQWTDHNDSDPGIHFFDVNAVNGAAHEYVYTQPVDGVEKYVSGAPLLDITGNGEPNGIIAILIGLLGPMPDVSYVLIQGDLSNTPIVGVTDSRGRIVLDGLEEGSYSFGVGDDANPLLQFELQVQKFGEQYVGLLLPAVQK